MDEERCSPSVNRAAQGSELMVPPSQPKEAAEQDSAVEKKWGDIVWGLHLVSQTNRRITSDRLSPSTTSLPSRGAGLRRDSHRGEGRI